MVYSEPAKTPIIKKVATDSLLGYKVAQTEQVSTRVLIAKTLFITEPEPKKIIFCQVLIKSPAVESHTDPH